MLWGGYRRWSTSLLCARIPPPHAVQRVEYQDLRACSPRARPATTVVLRRAPHGAPDDQHHHHHHTSCPPVLHHPSLPQKHEETQRPRKTPRAAAENLPRMVALIHELFAADVTVDEMASIIQHPQHPQHWMSFLRNARRVRNLATHLAKGCSPASAYHILVLASKLGTKFKSNEYEGLSYEFAQQKRWCLVRSVVEFAHKQLGKSSLRLLNWLTKATAELQDYTAVDNALQTFASFNITPDRRTYHILIRAHLLNHDLPLARLCMQCMVEAGFDVDASTFSTLVSSYIGLGPDKLVQTRAFRSIPSLNSKKGTLIANSILRITIDKGDIAGALKILNMFEGLDKGTILSTYDSANGNNSSASKREMASHIARADLVTFTIIIDLLAKHRDLAWLRRLMDQIKSTGLTPDAEIAAALIRALYAQNAGRLALRVLHDLCIPSTHEQDGWFKQLGYYAEKGDPTFGPFAGGPSVAPFNSFLQGALARSSFECIKPIWQLMRAFGIKPSSATVEILLSHSEKVGIQSSKLMEAAFSISKGHVIQSVRHVNLLLRRLVRAEKTAVSKSSWNALGAFVRGAVKPSRSPHPPMGLTTDITGPTSGILFPSSWAPRDVLTDITRHLNDRGVKGTRATFAMRMRFAALSQASSGGGPTARQVLNAMVARGMHPTAYHYAALMEAHTVAGDMAAAHSVLREAVANIHPSQKSLVVLHTILISGHARLGRPDRAMRALQNMIRENVAPDAAAVDAVVSAFFAVKAFRLARHVLLGLWPMVAPPVDGMRNASLLELMSKLRSMRGQVPIEGTDWKKRRRLRKFMRLWHKLFPSPRPLRFR